jgi:hypothetical protein
MGMRCIYVVILNIDAKWGWVFTPERSHSTYCAGGRVGVRHILDGCGEEEKSCNNGGSNPESSNLQHSGYAGPIGVALLSLHYRTEQTV